MAIGKVTAVRYGTYPFREVTHGRIGTGQHLPSVRGLFALAPVTADLVAGVATVLLAVAPVLGLDAVPGGLAPELGVLAHARHLVRPVAAVVAPVAAQRVGHTLSVG